MAQNELNFYAFPPEDLLHFHEKFRFLLLISGDFETVLTNNLNLIEKQKLIKENEAMKIG